MKDDLRNDAMIEATRLTREGRLAEATALIQRALGGGHAPSETARAWGTADEPIAATFRVVPEPGATVGLLPSPSNEAEGPTRAGRPRKAAMRARRVPAGGPAVTRFAMPRGGQASPGATVMAGGRWIEGTHAGASGTRGYKLY